jgi:hypothetical protein
MSLEVNPTLDCFTAVIFASHAYQTHIFGQLVASINMCFGWFSLLPSRWPTSRPAVPISDDRFWYSQLLCI